MSFYDKYFTNEDKPFAENLNDALLLSNVFNLTVPISLPLMFSNKTWVKTTSPRKCDVAICTLKEGLPSGISISTDSGTGSSILTGTGTVKLSFYPNFNSFGSYVSMDWENDGTIVVNLKTSGGTTIASNISKGDIEIQSSELRTLQEIVIEIVFTNATLYSFDILMANNDVERYGATIGISDVTGLDDEFNTIEGRLNGLDTAIDERVKYSDIKDNLTSTDTNKSLSAKQGKELKTITDAIQHKNNASIGTIYAIPPSSSSSPYFTIDFQSNFNYVVRNGFIYFAWVMIAKNSIPSATNISLFTASNLLNNGLDPLCDAKYVVSTDNGKTGLIIISGTEFIYRGSALSPNEKVYVSFCYPIYDY